METRELKRVEIRSVKKARAPPRGACATQKNQLYHSVLFVENCGLADVAVQKWRVD
jgi:hypothetical protein